MSNNNFFVLIWLAVAAGFVIFFFYALFASRHLKLRTNYGVWISMFAFLFVGVIITYVQQKNVTTSIQADQQIIPKQLEIKQINQSEIIMTWNTDKATFQSVRYKTEGRDWFFAFDEKMTQTTSTHQVRIKNLQKDKKYVFVIISGKNEFTTYNGSEISVIIK